jgi:hypothetical protein
MKIKIVLELSKRDIQSLDGNAIERVINTTLECLKTSRNGDRYINEENWIESKDLVVLLWNKAQDALFRAVNNMPEQE